MNTDQPEREPSVAPEDVRAIVRLLGRVADFSGTPVEKKQLLMDGLQEMLGANAWLWVVSRVDPGSPPTGIHVHHGGLTDREIGLIIEASQDTRHPPPENEPMIKALEPGLPVSRRRVDLVPDNDIWRGTSFKLYREPVGLDEFLYGIYPIADNLISGIGLHRKLGEPGFTERERQLLHIVITEIPWLHRAGLPDEDAESLDGYGRSVMDLSPRLRTVFGMLLQGWKRPQIADQLGISENTAKVYIRDTYRHFGVADHVGLLRRFLEVGDPLREKRG